MKYLFYTGLSEETIRRTENGLTQPSLNTLVLLSEFYGENLLVLAYYYIKKDLMLEDMVKSLEENIVNMDKENYKIIYKDYENHIDNYYGPSINPKQKKDYLFYKGVYLLNEDINSQAEDTFYEVIDFTNNKFNINKLNIKNKNSLDLRSLLNISILNRRKDDYDTYFKTMKYINEESQNVYSNLNIKTSFHQ